MAEVGPELQIRRPASAGLVMAILAAVTVILRMRLTPRLMSTRCRNDSSQPAGQPGRRQSPELDSDDDHVPSLPLPRLPAAIRVPPGTEKAPARGSPARAPTGPDSPGRCPSRHAPRAGLCHECPMRLRQPSEAGPLTW